MNRRAGGHWKPRQVVRAALAIASASLACRHTELSTDVPSSASTPLQPGPAFQLTYNVEQDYWPSWTSDGKGILYSFVTPGSTAYHRCVGMVRATGGTRIWELCDNRAVNADSAISYPAYAVDTAGRLLYLEAVAPLFNGISPPRGALTPSRVTLWLADTAAPLHRTPLLTLPLVIGSDSVSWLSDLWWTGDHTFVALAQDLAITAPVAPPCDFSQDSTFANSGVVVTGTIDGGHATLSAIAGASGASGYSLAEGGATVVFTLRDDLRLFRVPIAGGAPVAFATIPAATPNHLLGVACRGQNCLVANDAVILYPAPPLTCPGLRFGVKELRSVSIVTGVSQQLFIASDAIVSPRVSPVSGDVVYGVGGNFGHLQTIRAPSDGNLFMRLGVLP